VCFDRRGSAPATEANWGAFLAGVRRAELAVMKDAHLYCDDLKKWYKQAGGKNALRETDPKYAAGALDGCEMQNTLTLRTQAFA
jgi:hypothetical protein